MNTAQDIYNLIGNNFSITTDTRKITPGSIYFSLKGDNFNGNKFALEALKKGALYAIIDDLEYFDSSENRILYVKDVLSTLQELSRIHRLALNIPIISLTGSNGKTTTKELINAVLSEKYKTTATLGNLNNHIGVPLTLLSMNIDTEIGIVEMGANHQKEIEGLCEIACPDYGYITNFGKAHLEGFGGVEGVIKGKSEMYTYLKENDGIAFINNNDLLQITNSKNNKKHLFGKETKLINATPFLNISYKDTTIHSNLIGKYNLSNIQAAIAIGEYFNVPLNLIKKGIENYIPTNNRSQIITKGSNKIILDAYNANPSSMSAALENFHSLNEINKVVILGDMFELGETSLQEHLEIALRLEKYNFKEAHLIGNQFSKVKASKKYVQYNSFEAFKNIFQNQNSSETCYLIKGSRGMALERILDLII